MRRSALLLCLVLALVPAACRSTPPAEPQPFGAEIDESSDTFVVLGDSRRGTPIVEQGDEPSDAERIEFAEALRDERPAFVVHTGDMARNGSEVEDWQTFDVDFAPVRDAGIAMFPVLSNHEYRGPDGDALDLYFSRFPDLGRRNHYVRSYRGIRLVFLDSNTNELGGPRTERQLVWLRRRLDEASEDDSVRAVMLVVHHPPHSNRVRSGESSWVRDDVIPLAAQYPKVRGLFAGHVHSYERFMVEGIHCVTTGGGGSPLDTLHDADDPDARPDLYRGPRSFHYCRVRIGERITVEVVMRDEAGTWSVTDRFEL
jgi:3',5'-cyclic AMP phosphodiesterase CpdA